MFLLDNKVFKVEILFCFRRIDDDRGKSYELGQSSVKCMRGILECWIKQASRIELFKKNQCNKHALHCKFHLITGDTIFTDDEYTHLQVSTCQCVGTECNLDFFISVNIFISCLD